MTPQLTVSRSVLADVLNNLYPRDDDPGPYGPVIHRVAELMLNPQPLPPKQAWQREAWFGAAAADATIRYALDRQELAESVDAPNRITESVRASIQQFVDDLCPRPPQPPRPPRWPFPWPRPKWWDQGEIGPLDVLVAGARFHRVAELMPDNALAADFDAGADTLFEAGLQLAG